MLLASLITYPPDTAALSYGASKLFQILMPLGIYMSFRELPFVRQLFLRPFQLLKSEASYGSYEYFFSLLVGFLSWKVGCDFGFLIISLGVAPWERSFTLAGLIPYTIFQYLIYYLFGQKFLMQGQLNPFKEEMRPKQIDRRPPVWKQLFSKYFHESMNTTSYNIPLRQVLWKPAVDYGSIAITWSLYTSGIIFLQSGEINLDTISHFTFIKILAFYLVNVFGFILGYNLGELIYYGAIALEEWSERLVRERRLQALRKGHSASGIVATVQQVWVEFKSVVGWRIQPFLERYGMNWRWLISSLAGVAFVVLLEPSFAGAIFGISERLQQYWFVNFEQIDPVHVQQIFQASAARELPPASDLFENFPKRWGALYFNN